MGTYARIEISQDTDNADLKVKKSLKVRKTYKLLWETYFNYLLSQAFIHIHVLQIEK